MVQIQEAPRVVETARLRLRALSEIDLARLVLFAGEREVARGTLTMPHPYSERDARDFLARSRRGAEEQIFAVAERETDALVGACGVGVDETHRFAELGYWIGKPFWGRGYAPEACRALLAWAFEHLPLERVIARIFAWNRGSVRVVEKLGMTREGLQRQHFVKWGERQDVELWGLLASEWKQSEERS